MQRPPAGRACLGACALLAPLLLTIALTGCNDAAQRRTEQLESFNRYREATLAWFDRTVDSSDDEYVRNALSLLRARFLVRSIAIDFLSAYCPPEGDAEIEAELDACRKLHRHARDLVASP